MKISNINDFIIFISLTILYIIISIVLYFVFRGNLALTLFLEGILLVNLSIWIECNIFIRNFKERRLEIQEEKNN